VRSPKEKSSTAKIGPLHLNSRLLADSPLITATMSGPAENKASLYQQPHPASNPYLQHRGIPPYAAVEGPSPPRQPTPPGYSYNPQPQLDSGYGIDHANGHGNAGDLSQSGSAHPAAGSAAEQAAKAVRLRKACDSCSIRKVKVSTVECASFPDHYRWIQLYTEYILTHIY
jgi:hypothetical protein